MTRIADERIAACSSEIMKLQVRILGLIRAQVVDWIDAGWKEDEIAAAGLTIAGNLGGLTLLTAVDGNAPPVFVVIARARKLIEQMIDVALVELGHAPGSVRVEQADVVGDTVRRRRDDPEPGDEPDPDLNPFGMSH